MHNGHRVPACSHNIHATKPPALNRTLYETLACGSFHGRALQETENLDLPLEVVTKGVREVLEGRAGAYYWVLEVQGKVG